MQRSINKIFNEIKKAAKADAVVAKKAWDIVQKEKNNDVHN